MDIVSATLNRVIEIVAEQSGVSRRELSASSAIDQDVRIVGGDVEDLAVALSNEFGDEVWQWPWQRFVELNEGLALTFPFQVIKQVLTWPLRGSFEYPSPFERLELGHIAAVIDRGEWFEP